MRKRTENRPTAATDQTQDLSIVVESDGPDRHERRPQGCRYKHDDDAVHGADEPAADINEENPDPHPASHTETLRDVPALDVNQTVQ